MGTNKKILHFSARKNNYYDRAGLLEGRSGFREADNAGALEFVHYMRKRICPSLADIVFLYRDYFLPQQIQ